MRAKQIFDFGVGGLAALMMAACSGGTPPAAPASATPKAGTSTAPSVIATTVKAASNAHKSVFTVDKTLRDPFFPKSKRVEEVAAAPVTPVDVVSLLRAGFQGVLGAGETRIALINNVMLQPGRSASIPVSQGGQRREIKVTVRDVQATSVILEIAGQPGTVTISRPQR